MKNFLNKEIKLCLSPVNYLFLAFVSMMMIPDYPRYVAFFYICLSVFFIFNNSELNKDIPYSMILPITKKDIVKSRCVLVCAYELISVVLSIPFSVLFAKTMPSGNASGIEGNLAFYGLALIEFSVFHISFFFLYYKKAEKPGLPFLISSVIFWLVYPVLEFPIWTKDILNVEYFKILDRIDSESIIKQIPVFAAGILVYIFGWILTYKISAKRFEKVDL